MSCFCATVLGTGIFGLWVHLLTNFLVIAILQASCFFLNLKISSFGACFFFRKSIFLTFTPVTLEPAALGFQSPHLTGMHGDSLCLHRVFLATFSVIRQSKLHVTVLQKYSFGELANSVGERESKLSRNRTLLSKEFRAFVCVEMLVKEEKLQRYSSVFTFP